MCLWGRLSLPNVLVHVLLCFAPPMTRVGPICAPALPSDGGGELPGQSLGSPFSPRLAVAFDCASQGLQSPSIALSVRWGIAFSQPRGSLTDGAPKEAVLPPREPGGALGMVRASCWLWHPCCHKVAPEAGGASRPHGALDSLAGEEEEGRGMWL